MVFTGIPEIDICLFFIGLLAWIFESVFKDTESSEDQDSNTAKEAAETQRKQLVKCAMDHCNSLSFRSSEYCWKHQDGKRHETDGPGWWEEGGSSL